MEYLLQFLIICLYWQILYSTKIPLSEHEKLQEKFKWTKIDFKYENEASRQKALKDGSYIQDNNIPYGVAIWKDKIFITIPRRNHGVPATLNYIHSNSNDTSPLLIPYPDWASNRPANGNIISIFRINVDSCNRLWAIDTGTKTDTERIQVPRLLVINLATDVILRSYNISNVDCKTTYTNIFPDIRDSCEDAYAYAVDPFANGLLVYSYQRNESWRKTHPYFSPDPFQMEYLVNGVSFRWTDGIFGFALSECCEHGDRWAYLHPTSSLNEFKVNTAILRDSNSTSLPSQITVVATRSATFQAASQAYHEKSGIVFYSLVNKNAIGCWNTKKKGTFSSCSDIVDSNDRTMVYFSDVKIDKERDQLWAISNRFPEIRSTGLYSNQSNFRIFFGQIKNLIQNTKCE